MSAWDGSSTEYSCQSTSNCVSDNSNYSKHVRKCFAGIVDGDILPQLPSEAANNN